MPTHRITLPPMQLTEWARRRLNEDGSPITDKDKLRALENFDLQALVRLGLAVPREQPQPEQPLLEQPLLEQPQPGQPQPVQPQLAPQLAPPTAAEPRRQQQLAELAALQQARQQQTAQPQQPAGFERFLRAADDAPIVEQAVDMGSRIAQFFRGADDAPVGEQVIDVASKLGGAAINTLDFLPAQLTPTDPLVIPGTTDFDPETEAMLRQIGVLPSEAGMVYASIEEQEGANPFQRVRNFQEQPLTRQIFGGIAFDPFALAGAVGNVGRLGKAGRAIGILDELGSAAEVPADVRQAAQGLAANADGFKGLQVRAADASTRLDEAEEALDKLRESAAGTDADTVFGEVVGFGDEFQRLSREGDAAAEELEGLQKQLGKFHDWERTIDQWQTREVTEQVRRGAQVGSMRGIPFTQYHAGRVGGQWEPTIDFTPERGLHIGTIRSSAKRAIDTESPRNQLLLQRILGHGAYNMTSRAFHELRIKHEKAYLPNGRILDERIAADRGLLQDLTHGSRPVKYGGMEDPSWFAPEKLLGGEYDVVPYINAVEDPGSTSYLIIDPDVVLSTGRLSADDLLKKPRGGREAADVLPPFGTVDVPTRELPTLPLDDERPNWILKYISASLGLGDDVDTADVLTDLFRTDSDAIAARMNAFTGTNRPMQKDIDDAVESAWHQTQQLLESKGMPEEFTVYHVADRTKLDKNYRPRYNQPEIKYRDPQRYLEEFDTGDPLSVTMSLEVAQRIAGRWPGEDLVVFPFTVHRTDVLADVSGLLGKAAFDEHELLVRAGKLRDQLDEVDDLVKQRKMPHDPPAGGAGRAKRRPYLFGGGENIFGMTHIEAKGQLTKYERLQNTVRRAFGRTELSPHVQLSLRERGRIQHTVTSVATVTSQKVGRIARDAFEDMDAQGVIPSLKGVDPEHMKGHAPTLSDVAAALPLYRKSLTDEQLAAMEQIRAELRPFRKLYDTVFLKGMKHKRKDIMSPGGRRGGGGFYITRGSKDVDELDFPVVPRRGPKAGPTGAEYEALARAQGVDIGAHGGQWLSVEDAISSYVHGIGRRINDKHTANYFQYRAIDEAGDTLYGAGKSTLKPFPGLEHSEKFTRHLQAQIAERLIEEGVAAGPMSFIPRTIGAVNATYRGFKATADLSLFGVQAVLTTYESPSSVYQAMKATGKSLRKDGDKVLGEYIKAYDVRSPVTALDWAREGLRVGGSGTEFRIGGPFVKLIPIQAINRAFGQAGDVLRLELAEAEVINALSKGSSLDELRASGQLKEIAKAANAMTGWSQARFGGAAGEVGQFAPRFFQSRLDTLGLAIAGSVNMMRPGVQTPRDQVLARRAFLKMIGIATMITFIANESRGQDTDLRPIVDGKANPNFLRIKDVFGRDISLLGPWDSFQRLNVGLATGVISGDIDGIMQSIRGQSSGVVTNVWDAFAGTDFFGKPTGIYSRTEPGGPRHINPLGAFEQLYHNFIPFSGEEYLTGIGQMAQGAMAGSASDVATGATTFVSGLVGLRSSPLGFIDHGNRAAQESGLGSEWNDLEKYQQNFLGTSHPELAQFGDERQTYGKAAEVEQLDVFRETRIAEILNSRASVGRKRAQISRMEVQYSERRNNIFGEDAEIKLGDSPNELAMKERLQLIDAHKLPSGEIDWEALERPMRVLENSFSEEQVSYIRRNTNRLPRPLALLRVIDQRQRREIMLSHEARKQHLRDLGKEDLIPLLDKWFYPVLPTSEEAA